MPITSLPNRESGQQCYIMVGPQIKYEPAWQSPEKKQLLKKTGVNDCLSSATAGLNSNSIAKVRQSKNMQYKASKERAQSGALLLEDVGLVCRSGNIRSISSVHNRKRNQRMLTERDLARLQSQKELESREQQLKPR